MLSNFQVDSQSLLQSFLVGQPEFRGIMQRPEMSQLKQRVIASYHLGPLDLAETRGYIEHRLTHAGWSGHPRFEPAAFERIFTATAGVPRRINTLCDRLLLAAFLAERAGIAPADVDQVAEELREETGAAAAPATQPKPGGAAEETSHEAQIALLAKRVRALEAAVGVMTDLVGQLARSAREADAALPARTAAGQRRDET